MRLLLSIAFRHLLARKRQSIVSLMGIVLGVAFFLAISSMMKGSQNDFINRLIDNSPHITVSGEFRRPTRQPAVQVYPKGSAVEVRGVKPMTETRGIRNYERALGLMRSFPGLTASPVLSGQGLIGFAGRDIAVTISGMIPSEITQVSTIEKYMVEGTVSDLAANADLSKFIL